MPYNIKHRLCITQKTLCVTKCYFTHSLTVKKCLIKLNEIL